MLDRIGSSEIYEPLRDNSRAFETLAEVRAVRRPSDYGEGGDFSHQGCNALQRDSLSDFIAAEYDRLFNLYLASRPGSKAARQILAKLKNTPSV